MLDKKALRKFADANPAPAIPQNHGLLRAEQVDYIIRTAVRIINRRRTLVLYVYDRKSAANGNPTPAWTMFQAGADYITLARRDDSSIRWREASFENLGKDWHFAGQCAFYSSGDERRACCFFKAPDCGGIAALIRAQRAILDERARKRQLAREKETIGRMESVRALPRGLKGWVRREVMPAYFRCWHASVKKTVAGVCTSCGGESTLPSAAHNGKVTCPRCKRELTVKSAGKMGRHCDRDTVQVLERTGDAGAVVRIVKVWYSYGRDQLLPKASVRENARIFVRLGPDGKVKAEPYYWSYTADGLTSWKPGARPVFSRYQYYFEADICGHAYCGNLPGALAGTPWEYCPVAAFYEHDRGPMEMTPFLMAHVEHPRMEHLIKTGFFSLASDLAYGRVRGGLLDETQDRTHRVLQVSPGDVAFLRELDANADMLSMFRECPEGKDRQRLFLWRLEHGVSRDVAQVLEHVTPHRLMRFAGDQFRKLSGRQDRYGGRRYSTMQAIASEYRDYLDMCAKLSYDLKNSFVLYPRDLQEAHDRAQKRIKLKADAQMRRDFKAAMKAIADHLDFELDGMRIVLPSSPDEIIAEGHALHHCVGGYVDRVAKHECVILFLRRCDDLSQPFFTVEIRNRRAVQVRGMRNCDPTPEVRTFMDRFEKQVLQAA